MSDTEVEVFALNVCCLDLKSLLNSCIETLLTSSVCVCVCVLISGQLYLIMALQGLGVGLFSTLSALQSVCFHTVQSSEEEEAGKYHPINQSSKRFLQRPSS